MDDFLVKCEVVDFGFPPKKKIRYFFISFIKPFEQAKQLGNKNLLILSPYIDQFSEYGLLNVQIGYNFTPGLENWMINKTVMKFIVTPKENKSHPYDLNWTSTDISNSSFKIQLQFKNPLSLTYRDILTMKFIKFDIFFMNRSAGVDQVLPEDQQEEVIIDPVYDINGNIS